MPSLEERVRTLEQHVADLTARVLAIEGCPESAVAGPEATTSEPPAFTATDWIRGVPAILGRTCLVLGGAFLFRSLTESGVLSSSLGVALAMSYALVWLLLADRAAASGKTLSGAFHALTSALIAYPLVFEATTRFGLLGPATAAGVLGVTTFLGLLVAWRRVFPIAVWITVVAALADGVGLLLATQAATAFIPYLLTLAVGSLVLAYGHGWRGQRWLVAIVLDAVVLHLGALRLVGRPAEWLATAPLLLAQLGLVAVYLVAFVLRLLVQAHEITPFAIVQTAVVCVVGFEGALRVASGPARSAIAIAALTFGALLHVVLSRRSEQRWGHGAAAGYFSTLATFLAAEGTRVLLPGPIYPVLWALAAAAVAVLALPGTRPVLQAHAALLSAASSVASGLFMASLGALAFQPATRWPAPEPTVLIVLLLSTCTALLAYRGSPLQGPDRLAKVARLAALMIALMGIGGLAVRLVAGAIAQAAGLDIEPGRLAVVRTGVLAGAALLLAARRAGGGRSELSKLSAAVMLLAGVKLVFEDLLVGSAGILVFSLVLYGTALIVVPALSRVAERHDAVSRGGGGGA